MGADMTDLKTCPGCGKNERVYLELCGENSGDRKYGCDCAAGWQTCWHSDEESAREAWQTRALSLQPIATAPRDGTQILKASIDAEWTTGKLFFESVELVAINGESVTYYNSSNFKKTPLHPAYTLWMPLPEPEPPEGMQGD